MLLILVLGSASALGSVRSTSLRTKSRRAGVPVDLVRFAGGDDDNAPRETLRDAWDAGIENGKSILRQFTNPKIDDDGLVIADALIAGIARRAARLCELLSIVGGPKERARAGGAGYGGDRCDRLRRAAAVVGDEAWSRTVGHARTVARRDAGHVLGRRRLRRTLLRAREQPALPLSSRHIS